VKKVDSDWKDQGIEKADMPWVRQEHQECKRRCDFGTLNNLNIEMHTSFESSYYTYYGARKVGSTDFSYSLSTDQIMKRSYAPMPSLILVALPMLAILT
jgi:hypothetical protein